ncbi:hypothetical protein KRM28CT15_60740 [Krasilnikovia sp. M28-CT-15]
MARASQSADETPISPNGPILPGMKPTSGPPPILGGGTNNSAGPTILTPEASAPQSPNMYAAPQSPVPPGATPPQPANSAMATPQPMYATRPTVTAAPISRDRIDECLDSSKYWAIRLPRYANEMQRKSDTYALAAAFLSMVTGLTIWGFLAETNSWWAQTTASGAAFAAAACAIIPRVKNYSEAAGKARQLATQYGTIKGRLTDAQVWSSSNIAEDTALRQVVEDFEAIKSGKDSLVPYPKRYIEERHPEAKE